MTNRLIQQNDPSTKARGSRTPIIWAASAAAGWGIATGIVLLAWGGGPANAPAEWSPAERSTIGLLGLFEIVILSVIVWLLTRSRTAELKEVYAQLPARPTARRELFGIIIYAIAAQILGAALGTITGWGPISFHLEGSLHFSTATVPISQALGWAGYNFLMYVVLPLAWFGRRYTRKQLWLTSRRPKSDVLVIVAVLIVESAVQLTIYGTALAALTPTQLSLGVILAFSFSFVGTVMPTLVMVASTIVPRILAVTGSQVAAVVGGGVAYASLHMIDSWTDFSSFHMSVLSVALVGIAYFGPGMFKAFITLRTTNAWAHAWAYHAIAPHVFADTPMFARIFGIR